MVPAAQSPPENQADGNKCLVQAGLGLFGKQRNCKQREICMSGPEGSWVCLAELLTGPLCIFPVTLGQGFSLFSPENRAQNSVQACQEGNLVCGEDTGVPRSFRGDVTE